ncbi:putative membrane protein [Thiogranum longum]|uniref:Putative membrane protein n=1 Tax=Thiogranum longum TaxID=1537524 RepID=A0A4R1HHI1_9GAMM|nr:hypothetical protein [Thiogranum longum]TCK18859.1 putative membrane protein [Thiogranum longum]
MSFTPAFMTSRGRFYCRAGHITITHALILLLLAGCARHPVLEPLGEPKLTAARTWAWECESNFAFVAREEGNAMWLFLPDHAVQLRRVDDNSGPRYQSKEILFRHKNGQARLELAGTRYEHCRNNPLRAAREHARLNGIDFRATGNAPDWILEIKLDGDMQLVTGPDKTAYHFVTPEPLVIESEHKTLYSARNKHHQVVVELTGTPCHDATIGEMYEVSVNISLDDRKLKGCGGALH